MITIKNIATSARGFHAVGGHVMLEPGGKTEAEVYARERKSLESMGWFEVSGDFEPNPDVVSSGATSNATSDADLARKAAEIEKVFADRDAAAKAAVAERDDEISRLRDELAKAKAARPAHASEASVYAVKENSPGWYVVTKDGSEVTKSLRKTDVEGFDAMSDGDKAAFVDLHKAEA